jgi:membrane protein
VKNNLQKWRNIFKDSAVAFIENSGPRYSAALSYYAIFSIAPMLIVIIWLCATFFGQKAIEGEISAQIATIIGESPALQVENTIIGLTLEEDSGISMIAGLAAIIIGATVFFVEIQDSLNRIWGIKPKPKRGLVKLMINRMLSFVMVLSIGFLILVSLLINTLLAAFRDLIQNILPQISINMYQILNFIISFFIMAALFLLMFKVLPDARIKWKDLIVGAATTAILFIIGKFGITLYLSLSDVSSPYGAAGSVILILVWVYYSSFIMFFGAEFTQAYSKYFGSPITPSDYAVLVEQRELNQII